jgi:preprotein translocase subunit SecA
MINTFNKILSRFVGDKTAADIQEIQPLADKVLEEEKSLKEISNDELRAKSSALKVQIADYVKPIEEEINQLKLQAESDDKIEIDAKEAIYDKVDALSEEVNIKLEEILEQLLPEAFAIVKETARRFTENPSVEVTASEFDRELSMTRNHININGDKATWDSEWDAAGTAINWEMIHYDVQLIGGVALHKGKVAEMQTGEGKTLVATLPVFLNALTGKGVHLVTVNDYLAKRDSEWMAPICEFHGMSVDCIDKHKPNSDERRKAYRADVTYGTNNEFGFDYLRDNMATDPTHLVQRKHHFAIVDEVDSVLIDEARTPLIISGPTAKGDDQEFDELKPKVQLLYNAQKKTTSEFLTQAKQRLKGIEDGAPSKEDHTEGGLALLRAFRGLPKNKALVKYLSEGGVKRQLLKTEGFYMQDNSREMHLADEELFFTIDEKNNQVELTEKGIELMSKNMEDDNFFVMPDLSTEMVNIQNSDADEKDKLKLKEVLIQDFAVKSARIHTINQLLKSYALFEKDIDYVVMDNKVKIVDEQTGRIMDGRRYSDGLHQAIEAKENVKVEAATQTYATITLQNYFRMYHKLAGMTGTAETEAGELWEIYKLDVMSIPTNRPIARDDRQDLVYKTKREKYNAIIDEIDNLRGARRPVLVGTTTVEVSELLSKMLNMRNIPHQVLNAKLHQKEADIVAFAGQPGTVTIATNMAGRGTDIKLGKGVKESGGLAIVGTERHDSRRVDRQLRGRAGRQGDPGSSQFFVSLEDDLMRLFGSDRIAKMMDRLGIEEGEVIQHSMITKSIERAQKKVEENNFGVRKRLLEYDDVMSSQREVIYKRRKHALYGERLKFDILNMFYDLAENLIMDHQSSRNYEGFKLDVIKNFGIETPFTEDQFNDSPADALSYELYNQANKHYIQKSILSAEQAYPVIKNVFEDENNNFVNIAVPFTDGRKTLNVVANLERCFESNCKELIDTVERNVTLSLIDNEWKDHLRAMDDLRTNVQFASHEQKDPLLIYKFESYELFKKMVNEINSEVASFLVKCNLPEQQGVQQAQAPRRPNQSRTQTSKAGVQNISEATRSRQAQAPVGGPPRRQAPVVNETPKVGRNEPCPCGSGKKYKQCHGR